MSACKQINMEVKYSAQPIVYDVPKPIVLSLSKKIIPATIKESLNDLMTLQKTSGKNNVFSSASGLLKESVSVDFAKSIPLDVSDFKKESKMESKQKRKFSAREDAIRKMSRKDDLQKVSKHHNQKKNDSTGP